MNLPNDVLNIIFNNLTKTFQCMLSFTCKKLKEFRNIKLTSVDIAKDGELEFLKQCKNINDKIWKVAIKNGHIHILEWLSENYLVHKTNSSYCLLAAKYNQLKVLRWLHSKFDMGIETCIEIINNENIEMLEYIYPLFRRSCNLCVIAAANGKIKVLTWLKYKNDIISSISQHAVTGNHLNVLKWIDGNNIPIIGSCMLKAVERGYLDIIKFLVSIGFEFTIDMSKMANNYKHKHILRWCKDNGYYYEQEWLN